MNDVKYNEADLKVLTDAAASIFADYCTFADQAAKDGHFATAARAMRIAAAAANIVATRHAGLPLGLKYEVRAAECEAAERVYRAQSARVRGQAEA